MLTQRGYEIKEGRAGRFLSVTGPWSRRTERAVERGDLDGLFLNWALGFCEPDLQFLRDWPLKRLLILARWLVDLTPVYRLAATLEAVSLTAEHGAVLDCGRLPLLAELDVQGWRPVRATIGAAALLRKIDIWNYQGADLQPLARNSELRAIQLRGARSTRSLAGLEQLPHLASLSISHAPQLVDVTGLSLYAPPLRVLDFENVRNVDSLEHCAELTSLTRLGVNNRGDVDSIAPVAGLPLLETLECWGTTRFVDGNLSAVSRLPLLTDFRNASRRHYRPTVAALKAELGLPS